MFMSLHYVYALSDHRFLTHFGKMFLKKKNMKNEAFAISYYMMFSKILNFHISVFQEFLNFYLNIENDVIIYIQHMWRLVKQPPVSS